MPTGLKLGYESPSMHTAVVFVEGDLENDSVVLELSKEIAAVAKNYGCTAWVNQIYEPVPDKDKKARTFQNTVLPE